MSSFKTTRHAKIIPNTSLASTGFTVSDTLAVGNVVAEMSHTSQDGAVHFGFMMALGFRADIAPDTHSTEGINITQLYLEEASTWYARSEQNSEVVYELGDEDRKTLIPVLKEAILAQMIAENIITKACPPLSTSNKNHPLNIIINTDDDSECFFGAFDSMSGFISLLIDNNLHCQLNFGGDYLIRYKKASYVDGVLINAEINEIREIKLPFFKVDDFVELDSDSFVCDYTLTEVQLAKIQEIAMQFIKDQYQERCFPLGKNHLLSA